MPRIPQDLHERAIGMLNASLTMNAVAISIGCSTRAIRHFRQHFQQPSVRKINHLLDVRASRRVAKTDIVRTPTCAIASKLPHLLLLTNMVHITTVYLPKLCAIACAMLG